MHTMPSFVEVAESGPSSLVFAALQDWVQQDVGAIIFSCSTFDLAAQKSRRIHTNLPDIYPVSGLKDITPNRWTRQVLDAGKAFVANSLAEIREVFPDHETIAALGCGSVVNLPVFLAGRFMGTVNVLHRPGYYSADRLDALHTLRAPAMLAFACHLQE